jgi:hypothetical protein
MPRRYAEGTTVSVDTTHGEIKRLLKRYGCNQFGLAENPKTTAIQFVLDGLPYRFLVEKPELETFREAYYQDKYDNTALSGTAIRSRMERMDWSAEVAKEERRRWRARLLWIKATLEFAESEGREVLRQALMSQLVLPGGKTMGEWAAKQLPDAYASGEMPPLLT